jgi:hypothetical protein
MNALSRIGLRVAATAIGVAGVVDPSLTSNRATKPSVAVVAGDPTSDSVLAENVARTLSKQFVVTRGAYSGADATVLVGDRLASDARASSGPTFAVFAERRAAAIEFLNAPETAPLGSRVPVVAGVRVVGSRGRTLDVTLRAGSLVVDRASRTVASDDERISVPLTFVPPAAGAAPLRVSALIRGTRDSAATDVAVDVRDERWSVLFFDPRPSWMSTFVRRAIERDPRFVVTSRIVTSRGLSADAGQPPARLDDLAPLKLFDAVVVGAPESLTDRDVAGLYAFMRRRGGSVLLLLDRRAQGPYERFIGAPLASDSGSRPVSVVVAGDTAGLRASEISYPRRLPPGATPFAVTAHARADSMNGRAALWQSSIGAGRVIVSGALDAWRFRDAAFSSFDRFWQVAVAEAASASPEPVEVRVARSVARPGDRVEVHVSVRDAALTASPNPRASISASLVSDSSNVAMRLWPSGAPGEFRGEVRVPREGVYRVVVTSDGARGEAPLIARADAASSTPDDRDLIDAWVAARRGRSIASSQLDELPPALIDAIRPVARAETWFPMRSPWWIVPFALLLSTEWWARRRRGLA